MRGTLQAARGHFTTQLLLRFKLMQTEELQLPGVREEIRSTCPLPTQTAATAWGVGLITLAGAALRLHALTAKSFWLDETLSAGVARMSWTQFFLTLWHREANMALYFVLLRFWAALGTGVGIFRGLSVLFSVATIPLVFVLGSRLWGRSAGFLGAWLLAINAYHIRYAQEARSYAMVIFLATLATWLLVRNVQEPSDAHWGAYTAACVAVVYSHFFGGLVILAHCASFPFVPGWDRRWRDFVRSMCWLSLMTIPAVLSIANIGSAPIGWILKVGPGAAVAFLSELAGNGGPWVLALDVIAMWLAGFACWAIWRREGPSPRTWGFVLVFLLLILPCATVYLASFWRPMFLGRYLSPCVMPLALIVAAGTSQVRRRVLAWILGGAISLASFAGTISYYRADFDVVRGDWPGATSFVFDHAQAGDGIVFFFNFGRVPFEFYRAQRSSPPQWPETLQAQAGSGLTYQDFVSENIGQMLQEARPAGDRVWVVLLDDSDPDGKTSRTGLIARAVLGKGRNLLESRNYSGITVLLYSREDAKPAAIHSGKS
jgi:mannosyltransferase